MPDDSDYLSETEYEELPDEIEIDEVSLIFPDDQDIFCIEPEKFLSYMEEIQKLRSEDRIIIRTDHIVQAKISSAKKRKVV